MSSAERPLKRARTSFEADSVIHDLDFYYQDGNLALQLENETGDVVCFRVHKTIMAQHSPVFSDMFSIPEPPESDVEKYMGAAVVRLQDDISEFKDFLRFVYEPSGNLLKFRGITPDLAISMLGPLKLATKYGVEWIREAIIVQLKSEWPCDLAQFEAVETAIVEQERDPRNPAAVLRLALTCDVPSIVPLVIYTLLRSDEDEPKNSIEQLTIDDLRSLITARIKITQWLREHATAVFSSNFEAKCTGTACESYIGIRHAKFQGYAFMSMDVVHYVQTTVEFFEQLPEKYLCWHCRRVLIDRLKTLRSTFFTELVEGNILA